MKTKLCLKLFAFVLSLAVIFGMTSSISKSIEVYADNDQSLPIVKDINLGINGIQTPKIPESLLSFWEGSYLYFGQYEQDDDTNNGKEPILWNILSNSNDSNEDGQSDSLLLLSNKVLDRVLFNESTTDGNLWHDSNIRKWLNSAPYSQNAYSYTAGGFYDNAFLSLEQAAINSTSKTEHLVNDGLGWLGGSSLTGDKIFLLSAKEAITPGYGFYQVNNTLTNNNTVKPSAATLYASNKGVYVGNEPSTVFWWLRSPDRDSDHLIGNVNGDGRITYQFVNTQPIGVRPALNLNSSSILFTSAVASEKASFELISDDNVAANTWKLTIKGTDNTLLAEKTAGNTNLAIGYQSETLTVSHDPATILTNADQVSAMITDNEGTVLYYGGINTDTSATSSQIVIPAGLAEGAYNLYVFAEIVNGGSLTDYASALGDPISITVKQPYSVTITNPSDSNMTRLANSGSEHQENLIEPMENVIYIADDGYYFPESYSVDSSTGISVTRNSDSQITVSGMPSANANIVLIVASKRVVQPDPEPSYEIISGAGSVHKVNTDGAISIKSSGNLADLVGIYVNGVLVDPDNYTLESGSVIVTLKASYLNTLGKGIHTLRFLFNDGMSETFFEIAGVTSEPTEPNDSGSTDNDNLTTEDNSSSSGSNNTSAESSAESTSEQNDIPKTGENNSLLPLIIMASLILTAIILRNLAAKKNFIR